MKTLLVLASFCLVASGQASAQLYKNVSSSGKVAYADRPDDAAGEVLVMRGAAAAPYQKDEQGQQIRRFQSGMPAGAPMLMDHSEPGPKLLRMDVVLRAQGPAVAAGRSAFAALAQRAGLATTSR